MLEVVWMFFLVYAFVKWVFPGGRLDTRRPWGRGVREVTGGNRFGAQGPQGRRHLSTDCWFAFDRRCFWDFSPGAGTPFNKFFGQNHG